VKILLLVLSASFFCTLWSGCFASGEWNPFNEGKRNIENSKRLRIGMTKHEVLKIMGEPLRDETFCKPDIWYYYYQMNWGDGLTTEDECFPIVFKEGKVVGWGNAFLTKYRRDNKNRGQEASPLESDLPIPVPQK